MWSIWVCIAFIRILLVCFVDSFISFIYLIAKFVLQLRGVYFRFGGVCTSSTFGCNGISGLSISLFFTMLSIDGHRGSVGLTLYPLHRILWFVAVLSVSIIVNSSQYAIFSLYLVLTLVTMTITKKLWGTRNSHQRLTVRICQ